MECSVKCSVERGVVSLECEEILGSTLCKNCGTITHGVLCARFVVQSDMLGIVSCKIDSLKY